MADWRPRLLEAMQLLGIAFALLATAASKRLAGARRTERLLKAAAAACVVRRLTAERHLAAAERLSRRIERLSHRLPRSPRCLTRSLVLATVMRRVGAAATLTVGVRPGSAFAAHAWVEVDGTPVGADGAARHDFVPIWTSR